MRGYLLDTNHVGNAIRKTSHFRDRLHRMTRSGYRFGCCVPVLCELEVGIQQRADFAITYRRLHTLLNIIRIWPIDVSLARIYGEIANELIRHGRVLSQVDIMLAALAKQMNLTLLTADGDFQALPDVPTENWLS
jgi:tRNA(fMet)-specific endonuclease VapC